MIKLSEIGKIFELGEQKFNVLSNVNLEIENNEFVALTGASGSGKSTLMNLLGCLDSPSSGDYYLNGELISGLDENQLAVVRNRKIGFVFQSFYLSPKLSVLENVAQPLIYRGVPRKQRKILATEALTKVGLELRMQHRPNQLSGGQRQRVAIARALVGQPEILLADEPTGNLDSKTAAEIMELFCTLHKQGATIVLVTHEADIAAYCHRIIRLQDGKVVESL